MSARRAAEQRGRRAELWAALWLMGKGYRILAHRARTPFGEVDLAAVRGRTLAIVEVKARRSREEGLHAVGIAQRERIGRAGLALAKRFRLHGASVRLDLMIVRPWAPPIHVRNAWGEDRPI
ncbi:MAG: YraN family protein [Hyphomonadaceae bacterium]|nr:YraN family protein [Hyphomonadaceae bacterium]